MADSIDERWDAPMGEKDSSSEIAQLRSDIQDLRSEIARAKADAVREAKASIVIQGGGTGITVSGGNGTWTISGSGPTGGTVTGTFDCDSDPPIFNGVVTLS